MLKVALTGNIASGKSSVARVWESLGAVVVDADRLAREAVAPGSPGLRQVVAEWGTGVLAPDGSLDRAAMREIVFRDPAARARLEAIVHPEVARARDRAFAEAESRGAPLIVADIPLLFEVGGEGDFDVVVLVDAPESVRRERLVRDRGLEPDAAQRMIDAQMPAATKRAGADLVIDNHHDREALDSAAREAWAALLRRAEERR